MSINGSAGREVRVPAVHGETSESASRAAAVPLLWLLARRSPPTGKGGVGVAKSDPGRRSRQRKKSLGGRGRLFPSVGSGGRDSLYRGPDDIVACKSRASPQEN